jgi:hypothetical protein
MKAAGHVFFFFFFLIILFYFVDDTIGKIKMIAS